MYLRISSPGETSPEAFTVLGASSARGDASKIGQFGSGAKHAILCALRAGLELLIYCGRTKIVPMTQPQTIHGTVQERVCFRIDNRTETSSMTLDFGALDWSQSVPMMLRELISNALDACDGQWDKIGIDYCTKPRARAGYTTIYVQLTNEIREYVANIHERFLHVSGKQETSVIENGENGTCKFYRKGVFVHEIANVKAMYSYNCGDELPIDESRNLDSHRVRNYAAKLLCDDETALQRVLRQVVETQAEFYERCFSYWHLESAAVGAAMRALYGDDVCVTDTAFTFNRAVSKGLNVKLFNKESSGWLQSVVAGGVSDAISKLSKADSQGLITFAAGDVLTENALVIWDCMAELNLVGSVDFPALFEYEKPMSASSQTCGFYDEKEHAVYIHRDYVDSWQVIIEEFAHAVTGASDETRDFQDYAFRLTGVLMRKVVGR